MRYSLLAYNKDKDIYDGIIESDNKEELEMLAGEPGYKLHKDELKEKNGRDFDWACLWGKEECIGDNAIDIC